MTEVSVEGSLPQTMIARENSELLKRYQQKQLELHAMLRRTQQLSATLELLSELNQYTSPKDVLYQAAQRCRRLFHADGVGLVIRHADGLCPLMIGGVHAQRVTTELMTQHTLLREDERALLLSLPESVGGQPRHVLASPFGASWDIVNDGEAASGKGEKDEHELLVRESEEESLHLRLRSKGLLILWSFKEGYGLWDVSLLETLSRGVHGLLQGLECLQRERAAKTALEYQLQRLQHDHCMAGETSNPEEIGKPSSLN